MLRAVVTSTTTKPVAFTGYSGERRFQTQQCEVWFHTLAGETYKRPRPVEVPLAEGQAPYPVGEYFVEFDDTSFRHSERFGTIAVRSFKLVPAA